MKNLNIWHATEWVMERPRIWTPGNTRSKYMEVCVYYASPVKNNITYKMTNTTFCYTDSMKMVPSWCRLLTTNIGLIFKIGLENICFTWHGYQRLKKSLFLQDVCIDSFNPTEDNEPIRFSNHKGINHANFAS